VRRERKEVIRRAKIEVKKMVLVVGMLEFVALFVDEC
jgi:hypothetical protein